MKSKLLDDYLRLKRRRLFNDVRNGHLVIFEPANAFFKIALPNYAAMAANSMSQLVWSLVSVSPLATAR